jgi:hypothetical protein
MGQSSCVDELLDVDWLVSSHDYSLRPDSVCDLSVSAVQNKHVPRFSSAKGQSGSDWILPEACDVLEPSSCYLLVLDTVCRVTSAHQAGVAQSVLARGATTPTHPAQREW